MRVLFVFLILFLIPLASSAVYINEIVPDPTDDCLDCTEWIELYNDGDADVDVANWTLKDKKERYLYIGAEYTEGGSTEIPVGGYIVVYPGKEGLKRYIYLTNGEDVIKLFDGDSLVDEASYSFSKDYDVAWARVPDGSDNWEKTASTRGGSNGAPPAPEDSDDDKGDDDSDAVDDENNSSDAGGDNGKDGEASDDNDVVDLEPEAVVKSVAGDGKKVTGKTVYVSDQKKSLTKPLLLLLLGLLVIAIALQMQLMSKNRGGV